MVIHITPVKHLHATSDNNTQYVLSLYVLTPISGAWGVPYT